MGELTEKVKASIERLKAFEPPEGYYLAFSGGKDSVVCKALLDMAGCKYDSHYRVTSVDFPELFRFIKEHHKDVAIEVPTYPDGKPKTMWSLIKDKAYPPTRVARYCCKELKEDGGDGRLTVTGVRWAESVNRQANQGIVTVMGKTAGKQFADDSNFAGTKRGGVILTNDNTESRRTIESCYKRHKTTINPIIDWENSDVWNFIRGEKIPYCHLYDEGWHRLGCIGCPMASRQQREKDFVRWSGYKRLYLTTFDKMLDLRRERHAKDPSRPVWRMRGENGEATGTDVFKWWMEYDELYGQIDILGGDEDD